MAAEGSVHPGRSARFAAACGVLSQYVKAAERAAAVAVEAPRPVAVLPLMPGADVPAHEEPEAAKAGSAPAPAPAAQQMTISYGGRVLVLDDVPADRAAELLRLASAQGAVPVPRAPAAEGDLPMARKASLQRFMEKRRGRAAARAAPYSRPDADVVAADEASPSFPDHLKLAL